MELVHTTRDDSSSDMASTSATSTDPLLIEVQSQRLKLISIEGNIGAGKSSLLRALSSEYQIIEEPLGDWEECLSRYYKYPYSSAYDLQLKSLESFKDSVMTLDDSEGFAFIERSLYSMFLIFIELAYNNFYLERIQKDELEELTRLTFSQTRNLGAIFYVHTPAEICYERMIKRDRPAERRVTFDYIKKLGEQYDKVMVYGKHRLPIPVFILDGTMSTQALCVKINTILKHLRLGVAKMVYPDNEPIIPEYLLNTLEPKVPVHEYELDYYNEMKSLGFESCPHLIIKKHHMAWDAIPPSVSKDRRTRKHNLRSRSTLTIKAGETRKIESGLRVSCGNSDSIITVININIKGLIRSTFVKAINRGEITELNFEIRNDSTEPVTLERCESFATMTYRHNTSDEIESSGLPEFNEATSILKFDKLDRDNYLTWQKQMRKLLTNMGCIRNIVEPADPTSSNDIHAYIKLLEYTNTRWHPYIEHCSTAYDIWKRLEGLNAPCIKERVDSILTRLFSSKHTRGTSLNQHISQMGQLRSKLAEKGEQISDQVFITALLLSLGDQYDILRNTWYEFPEEDRSVEQIIGKIIKIHARTIDDKYNQARILTNKMEELRELKNKNPCSKCGRTGHWAKECKSRREKRSKKIHTAPSEEF